MNKYTHFLGVIKVYPAESQGESSNRYATANAPRLFIWSWVLLLHITLSTVRYLYNV
jgi:hypothetical protein